MVPENITDERRTLGSLLRRLYQTLSQEVYQTLGKEGFSELRVSHGAVFRTILPNGMRTTDLAQRAGMTKQSMGALVADLEATGYVELLADPQDGRAKLVCLTEKGRLAQEAAARISGEVEARWAKQVGGREWHNTRRTLERLVEGLP